MTRGTTIALTFAGVLGLGLLIAGVASADTPSPLPKPKPKPKQPFPIPFPDPSLPIPVDPTVPDPIIFFDPIAPIQAEPKTVPAAVAIKIPITQDEQLSGAKCQVDGEKYNVLQWPAPEVVAFAMRALGFGVTNSLTSAADVAHIKTFQLKARQLNLDGMKNAPDDFIDGKFGVCTLRGLTQASILFNAGAWPG